MKRSILLALILVGLSACGADTEGDYTPKQQPQSKLANEINDSCPREDGVASITSKNGQTGWTDFLLVVCKDGTVRRVNLY